MSSLEYGFMFRIKFQTPENQSLDMPEGKEIKASLYANLNIVLKDISKEDSKAHVYVLTGGPFESSEKASAIGTKTIKNLLIFFTNIRRGISFGSFEPRSIITEAGQEYFKELFRIKGEVLPDNFGLTIYENKKDIHFLSSDMKFVVTGSGENLIKSIINNINLPIEFNERNLLILEMFTSSFFEKTNSSRFIKLMICIESMLDFEEKDCEIITVIDCLIRQINESDIKPLKRNSLSSSLGQLRKESITEAGMRFSNENLPGLIYNKMLPGDFFKYCYELRSKLLHEGNISKEIDIILGEFERYIWDLIKVKILT